jgi:SAM-dependent methyltransferase
MALPIFSRIQRILEQGPRLPLLGVRVRVKLEREAGPRPPEHHVFRNTLRRLITLFPELKVFDHPSVDDDARACAAALDFLHEYIPLIHDPARETQKRRLLTRLRDRVTDEDYRRQLTREIAKSDVRSGVPERATILLGDVRGEDEESVRDLQAQIARFEERYGARAGLITSLDAWSAMAGDVRGQSLVAYFAAHREAIRAKAVLHVGPEPTLRGWIEHERAALGLVEYVTLDPFSSSVDLSYDLTELDLPDAHFDLVICHRVLEHVLDDGAAMREMCRVLKPGGTLNLSVPQSVNLDTTNEWVIPDESHHHHVRQYGYDLEARLGNAGFDVRVEPFLLDRTREQHVAAGTYPLRIYLCTRR